ncbi:Regulator of microtubule dynamics protein 1 [Frankliniella fusca]|uniref:Regulator of microtubule dynamics protein 1 n=1 Tax=Frankliniella fusca TaxID=407009 RepID=A0AAE1HLB4_9NEOP|nr:Regulator of microtubule dynamics protein 1 [Frankliniella fusca]
MPSALGSVLRLARRVPVATLAAAPCSSRTSSGTSRTHYRRRHQRHQQDQQEQRACGCGRGAAALGLTVATFSQLPQQQDEADGPAAALVATAEPDDDVLDLVDELSAWERVEEARKELCSFGVSRHPEVLWREARLCWLQAERLKEQQQLAGDAKTLHARLVAEGYACVQLALQLDPACGRAHQWMSALRYARAELRGPLARLRCVDQLRLDMERAVQLLPADGAPRTMLGMWYYEVSQLNWVERQAVKAAGQTVPGPAECLSLALHWMMEADALYASCLNDLMLGKTLLAMGDSERARTYVERAARRAPRDQSDVKAQLEAAELLEPWRD